MPKHGHTLLFFVLVLLVSSWHIDHGRNDSTVSRAAMVAAIVEDGTFRIDRFHELTGDKSFMNGHYYSDKAPLPALLLVPVYWSVVHAGLYDPAHQDLLHGPLLRLGGFFGASLPFALMVTLVWRRHVRAGSVRQPAVTTAAAFIGSFLFGYTGNFNAHLLAACFLVLALIAWERERFALCGFLSGAAVSCEYPLFIFPTFWMILLFSKAGTIRTRGGYMLRFMLGALPFLILHSLYNTAITGSPVSIGYQHEVGYTFMRHGFGFTYPRPEALWGLTFSSYRGVFIYAPVLVAVLIARFQDRSGRSLLFRDPVLVPSALLLLLISSYAMWWGGWSFGPRHLIGAVALLLYRGMSLLDGQRIARGAFVLSALFGLVLSVSAISTVGSSFPTEIHEPLTERILPALIAGQWSDAQLPLLLGWSVGTCTMLFLVLLLLTFFAFRTLDRRMA